MGLGVGCWVGTILVLQRIELYSPGLRLAGEKVEAATLIGSILESPYARRSFLNSCMSD